MAATASGVIKEWELDTWMPRAAASPRPAPAKLILNIQVKRVTICLLQCCSPSVRATLAGSTAKRAANEAMDIISPRIP